LSYSVAAASLPLAVSVVDSKRLWTVATALWVFHFLRRTAESLWVHRYSGRPVPLADALIEYVYYWGFGAWIGIAWAGAAEPAPSGLLLALGVLIALVGETGNAWAHLELRNLRRQAGIPDRTLPYKGPFQWVDCPHYLFEILTWLGFALVTGLAASWVFAVVVAAILAFYARERHRRYQKEFDGQEGRAAYPATRRALLPRLY
jgi:very-long-chain enoyl-CoA reductase